MWKSGSGVYHLEIDMLWGINLLTVFERWFKQRVELYEAPAYDRSEDLGDTVRFNFDMRELTEAFFHTWTSEQFAYLIRGHTNPDTTDENLIRTIEILDDFFHYGYILNEGRIRSEHNQTGVIMTPDPVNLLDRRAIDDSAPRYEFWRIFSPSITSKEWERLIPKKYWSKSVYGGIQDHEGIANHFTLLLMKSRKYDVVQKILCKSSDMLSDDDFKDLNQLEQEPDFAGIPRQDFFRLRKLVDSRKKINAMDEIIKIRAIA